MSLPINATPDQILEAMANTFRERNAVYGDNWKTVGNVMEALFPEGIVLSSPSDFCRWHLLELLVVKLTRFANSGMCHMDSIHDASVYGAMLEAITDPAKPILGVGEKG